MQCGSSWPGENEYEEHQVSIESVILFFARCIASPDFKEGSVDVTGTRYLSRPYGNSIHDVLSQPVDR